MWRAARKKNSCCLPFLAVVGGTCGEHLVQVSEGSRRSDAIPKIAWKEACTRVCALNRMNPRYKFGVWNSAKCFLVTAEGCIQSADRMSEWYELKVRATSGSEMTNDEVVRILNRQFEWKEDCRGRRCASWCPLGTCIGNVVSSTGRGGPEEWEAEHITLSRKPLAQSPRRSVESFCCRFQDGVSAKK